MKRILVLVIALLLLTGCGASQESIEELENEISALEDTIFEQQETIFTLTESADFYEDELNAQKDYVNDLELELEETLMFNENIEGDMDTEFIDKFDALVAYSKQVMGLRFSNDQIIYHLVQPGDPLYPYHESEEKTTSVILKNDLLVDEKQIDIFYEDEGITDFNVSETGQFASICYSPMDGETIPRMVLLSEEGSVLFEATMDLLTPTKEAYPYERIYGDFTLDETYFMGTIGDAYSVSSFFAIDLVDYSIMVYDGTQYDEWQALGN